MENQIVNHIFEFWREIGRSANFLKETEGYTYTSPYNFSWPSNIFDLTPKELEKAKFLQEIENRKYPNSIVLSSDNNIGSLIDEKGFTEGSQLKCMYLDLKKYIAIRSDYGDFDKVTSSQQIEIFAAIASASFNYPVLYSTIERISKSQRILLFLGKFLGTYVSCGILYLDKRGGSGIHMIGTLPKYRGKGLGKTMTKYLIDRAHDLDKPNVYLMASEAGERIYTKMGFKANGAIHNFSKAI